MSSVTLRNFTSSKGSFKMPLTENQKRALFIGGVTGVGITCGAIGGAVICAIAAPFVLPALGFTAAGVTAGSIAAAIQGPAVAAGSAFAIAQSVGATVTVAGAMGVGAAAGGVAGATAGGVAGGVTGVAVAVTGGTDDDDTKKEKQD
eukprot:TRINITY_DN5815_c0_g1_i2.p1 TRINITY_DN5815_c0_g1~~TRINITY_DN5815_c0_g1_i2.p1  ORF type:complete len:147 (+),score=33.65 TRINITY_DN5815_c0_g1_i2:62-502(+)